MESKEAQRHRILLVDDETNFLWSVARALDVKGYDVSTSDSVESALEKLRARHYDLVLTDIKMPGMDGYELVEWLRVHRPDTSVVMATAFGSLSMRERALQLGAISYIEKPIDLNALMEFLQNLFHGPGFAGRIRDIDLLDYLQLICNTHKTKVVQISNRRAVGRLAFENGQLIHASVGDQVGIKAFHDMMSWQGGAFSDIPFEPPSSRTIDENTPFLLMEAARVRDDLEKLGGAGAHGGGSASTGAGAGAQGAGFSQSGAGSSPGGGRAGVSSGAPRPAESVRTTSSSRSGMGGGARGTSEERQGGGPFGQFRRFLEGLDYYRSVKGSALVSREGLILARSGAFPVGLEPVVARLAAAADALGEGLELGDTDTTLVGMEGASQLLVQRASDWLVAVVLQGDVEVREVSAWLRGKSICLE